MSAYDRPEGLALNQGGTRSQANLDIVNAFRRARNLSEVTLDQLAKRYPYFEIDLRVTKILTLGGERRLELMAEAFNATNRTNFGTPNGNLSAPTFLTVSSAGRRSRCSSVRGSGSETVPAADGHALAEEGSHSRLPFPTCARRRNAVSSGVVSSRSVWSSHWPIADRDKHRPRNDLHRALPDARSRTPPRSRHSQ